MRVRNEELPEEFPGRNAEALGLQGPCHNVANAFRNKGYVCTVEVRSEHSCKLIVMAGKVKYTIMLSDFLGSLIKNVFRGEKEKSVDLLEVKNRTKLDNEVLYLNICDIALTQSSVTPLGYLHR